MSKKQERPDWIEAHWIASELRSSKRLTRPRRDILAARLDALEQSLVQLWKQPRGRPQKRFSVPPGTSTFPGTNTARALAGIANQLTKDRHVSDKAAIDATLNAVGVGDSKFRQTVVRTLYDLRRGKIGVVSYRTKDYEAAARALPKIHRIK